MLRNGIQRPLLEKATVRTHLFDSFVCHFSQSAAGISHKCMLRRFELKARAANLNTVPTMPTCGLNRGAARRRVAAVNVKRLTIYASPGPLRVTSRFDSRLNKR